MTNRRNYEMSQKDLDQLLAAMKPIPLIMLQCGEPPSLQESANNAWKQLGTKMGFDHMTVRPTGDGDRFFSAIPLKKVGHNSGKNEDIPKDSS